MTKLFLSGIFVKNKRFLHPAINGLGVEMTRLDVCAVGDVGQIIPM